MFSAGHRPARRLHRRPTSCADPHARARTFGTDSVLATRFWTAVKTGTSKDMRDNWAMGWSAALHRGCVGGQRQRRAHVGRERHQRRRAHLGGADELPAHRPSPAARPRRPPAWCKPARSSASRAARRWKRRASEWFIAGTEQTLSPRIQAPAMPAGRGLSPPENRRPSPDAAPRITAPAYGTIVALDPDIPPKRQRISVQRRRPRRARLMDGKEFARGPQAHWMPWPAGTWCSWWTPAARWPDEIKLEVRGAGVREARAVSRGESGRIEIN